MATLQGTVHTHTFTHWWGCNCRAKIKPPTSGMTTLLPEPQPHLHTLFTLCSCGRTALRSVSLRWWQRYFFSGYIRVLNRFYSSWILTIRDYAKKRKLNHTWPRHPVYISKLAFPLLILDLGKSWGIHLDCFCPAEILNGKKRVKSF